MLTMSSSWLRWLGELEQRKLQKVILIPAISQVEPLAKPICSFVFFKEQIATYLGAVIIIPISKAERFAKIAGCDMR